MMVSHDSSEPLEKSLLFEDHEDCCCFEQTLVTSGGGNPGVGKWEVQTIECEIGSRMYCTTYSRTDAGLDWYVYINIL